MYNRVVIVGRLVSDPKAQSTKKGGKFLIARLASTTYLGDNKEELFINVVIMGNMVARCETQLKKGLLVIVEGRLRMRQWADPDGNARSTYEVVASSIRLLSTPTKDKKEEKIEEFVEEDILEPF